MGAKTRSFYWLMRQHWLRYIHLICCYKLKLHLPDSLRALLFIQFCIMRNYLKRGHKLGFQLDPIVWYGYSQREPPTVFIWLNHFLLWFSAPSRARNVRVLASTDTTIQISWWEPARANGLLQGYRIYMLHQNFTSVQTVRNNKSAMVETLTRLSKYHNFSISTKVNKAIYITMWLNLSCAP